MCNPSKGADGRPITTTTQLLGEWEKFLGAKFQRPAADADRNLENSASAEDALSEDELRICLNALRSGKAAGWDNVPVEAYRGPMHATNELFRLCRLMWQTERIPQNWCDVFSSCYTRRAAATTWRTNARSASSATRTICSRPSWRVY